MYQREFQFQTDSITVDVKGRKGTIAGAGRKLSSRSEPIETILPELPAAVRPMWGYMPDGMAYLNSDLPWVRYEHPHVAVDPEIAAQYGILITVEGVDVRIKYTGTLTAPVFGDTLGMLGDDTLGELHDDKLGEFGD